MKKSQLSSFIKENIVEMLSETDENDPVVAKGEGIELTKSEMERLHKGQIIKKGNTTISFVGKMPQNENNDLNTDSVVSALKNSNMNSDASSMLFKAYKDGHLTADSVIKIINGEKLGNLFNEATIETSTDNLDKVKRKADEKDTIKIIDEDRNEPNRGLAYIEEDGYEDGEKTFERIITQTNFKNSPDLQAYMKGFTQALTDGRGNVLFEKINESDEEEMDDDSIDKQAVRQAKKGKGKTSKLDAAVKSLQDTKKEMVTLVNLYKKAEGDEKAELVKDLKIKTNIKKELESLIKKLEKSVV